jgi:hypothetical protein
VAVAVCIQVQVGHDTIDGIRLICSSCSIGNPYLAAAERTTKKSETCIFDTSTADYSSREWIELGYWGELCRVRN